MECNGHLLNLLYISAAETNRCRYKDENLLTHGSICNFFIPLENFKIKNHFQLEVDHVFLDFRLLLFDSGVCLPSIK